MKRSLHYLLPAMTALLSFASRAQDPPRLDRLTFRVDNQIVTCVGNARVEMTMIFDTTMDTTVTPQAKFGLSKPYSLNLPMIDRRWVDSLTFFARFNINEDVPSSGDGEYTFLISGARSKAGLTMPETSSDTLRNRRDEKATLFIDRRGLLRTSSESVAFGTLSFGSSRDSSIVLENGGCSSITITGYNLNSGSLPFALLQGSSNVILGRGERITLTLRFRPQRRGVAQGRLLIYFQRATLQRDTLRVALTGQARGPRLVLIPADTLRFGRVQVNTSVTATVQVINDSAGARTFTDPLAISSITSSNESIFTADTKALQIAAGDTKLVRVTFRPNEVRSYQAFLQFRSNDLTLAGGQRTLPMLGSASPTPQPPPPITSVNVNWNLYGGYPGYAAADTLYLCLPTVVPNVAFVRWKIIPGNVPPQSPTDYTGSGVPIINGSSLCFKIPLRGVVSAGRNNCWIWLDGTNGTSGYNNSPFYSPLYYYVGAPVLRNFYLGGGFSWPGGFPYYLNGGSIPFCWQVQDGRNIAEIRWRFVRDPNTRPASATDTTNGGYYRLATNDTVSSLTCVNLSLSKLRRLGQGNWYVYVWLVDKAGNSGHASAYRWPAEANRPFWFDTTSAGRPTSNSNGPWKRHIINGVLSTEIQSSTWFGAGQLLRFSFKLPANARDAARVFWKFKTPPASQIEAQGEAVLTRVANDSARFSVLFNSTDLCGDDSLYVWVADSAGNVNPNNYSAAHYRFDMCAPEIRRVKSLSNNVALIGQDFLDRLVVTDSLSGVDTVWVHYRLGGAATEAPPVPALRVSRTDTFRFTIPLAGVTRRGIEFRAVARDKVAGAYNGPNLGYGPINGNDCRSGSSSAENTWYPIRTRVIGEGDFRIDSDGRPVPLVSGDSTTSYQLISIPYDLDDGNAINVLKDDLGDYDAKQWRLFDYLPQNPPATRWQEGTKARTFTPGRAFFAITRKQNTVFDGGPGQTRRTVCPDTLTMYEGWNLIATPFNFPVHKRSLRLINADKDTVSLWSFERQWTFSDVMDPWRGYAIYVTRGQGVSTSAPLRLIVQPVAVPGRLGKVKTPAMAWQAGEWAVQISARAGEVQDQFNWAGIRRSADIGYDATEMAEPPVIGDYVAVSFPHPEWRQPAENFCTDFRASHDADQVWDFEVATNQTRREVRLHFTLVGDFPANVEVYLIDEALGLAQNLRTKAEYTFHSSSQPLQKRLKLLVGKPEFVSKQAGAIALVPEKFELLQNFPNPFNPETSIRYNLPEAAVVTLVIYDQLGRKVRTLVNQTAQPAGYHRAGWDGRDEAGRPVATGIYLYKITAGRHTQVRKMVLQK
ncbi:MAG: choice-of-anchor D domain-containing protein [candidate division KSB1 bacterium]|nr:choice-of-anchor D domain-containing protein [candidate division KSB1 bacterium]MDZ7307211.1 choice-of-anchor D domain-containing protein [candidate division KSB1 bacterium]MDZ7408891.1 choice-of-anchor D domain-containing protein [candidate division KSB1 bacterium]